jgi:tetratricopeptide (TPR) repeat protein
LPIGGPFEESIELFRELGDKQGIAAVLNGMGEIARADRTYPQAIQAYEESLQLYREARDQQNIALTETNLAYVLYHCGEYDRAKALLTESLRLYQEVVSAFSAGWALVAWAGIVRAQGDPHKAATLIGAAGALAAQGGTLFDPLDQEDREEIEAAIRSELSEDDWRSAQEGGRAMSMDEAIHYALEMPSDR